MRRVVHVYLDAAALARAAAERVLEAAAAAIRERGQFSWCLSGGRTPRPTYELLATEAFARRIDWGRTDVFFADERCVPSDDEASNYRMARRALLDRVPLSYERVHCIECEHDPLEAAAAYETSLREFFGVDDSGAPLRGFDLAFLGLGSDGHTASLFPGSEDERDRWASPRRSPAGDTWRVTLTPRVLEAAVVVCFLVSGIEKGDWLAQAIIGPERPRGLPAQRIRPVGELAWLVDQGAAEGLLSGDGGALRERGVAVEVHR